MSEKCIGFVKKEPVLFVSVILAAISSFIILPSEKYMRYPDYRVLSLLFCLMLVVAGLKDAGVFEYMAQALLQKVDSLRKLVVLLVFLCFFTSMFITNDVALLTFVPFTIMLFEMGGFQKYIIRTIVLQTIAANLGSMSTPVGNPQNIYLYSHFHMSSAEFFKYMMPLSVASAVLLIGCTMTVPKTAVESSGEKPEKIEKKSICMVYMGLFVLCILCVLRMISFEWMLLITVVIVLITDRKRLAEADYKLLFTFLFFFIFIGNLKNMESIREVLMKIIDGHELILGIGFSQIISNVPAAILMSGFTHDAVSLLQGVNIGGLGTLIASLASVISYQLYAKTDGKNRGRYMLEFSLYNLLFLSVLILITLILY